MSNVIVSNNDSYNHGIVYYMDNINVYIIVLGSSANCFGK